jgi:propanol-preferring alcohol dehydrogenase
MKAMVLKKPDNIENSPLELMEIPVKQPSENEVLLKVKTCGVCHTDLHIVEGELDPLPKLPIVPGHEIVAVVDELGDNVTC